MISVKDLTDKDYDIIQNIPRLKRTGRKHKTTKNKIYRDCICSFDIETSRLPDSEHSFMYIWQFNILGYYTIYGRYWNEFIYFLNRITEKYNENEYIIIFVHNLSFEMQFLRGVLPFNREDVFCTDRRKILYAISGNAEFRCSYFLTNMSLSVFLNKMGVEHQKDEKIDYSIVRYPWDKLDNEILHYSEMDVVGLSEGIKKNNEINGDNLYTMPYTSTGYVRRLAKNAISSVNYQWRKNIQPDKNVYELLRQAFRGGNTHANRFFIGQLLTNVKSIDRSSSYSSEMVNRLYPISEFKKASGNIDYYLKKGKACLFIVELEGVSLKNDLWGCPYLPLHKCRNVEKAIIDNGRILSAVHLEITITDVDYKILIKEYKFMKYKIKELYVSTYGKLPKVLINLINNIYAQKTALKGIKGQEIYYHKQKELLNSLYGMCVQDPVKDRIYMVDKEYEIEKANMEDVLYRNRNKAFLPYQWGVWVACYAREELEKAIEMSGYNFVYTDTDSVKYIDNIEGLSEYNKKQVELSKLHGAYAKDKNGDIHYMGVYEQEAVSEKFITFGAKKYASESGGKLKITIAGVNKEKGSTELEHIENLKEGYIFKDAGGTESVYNDGGYNEILHTEYIEGHILKITSNITIKESTYKLGFSKDYYDLLCEIQNSGLYYKVNQKLGERVENGQISK